MAEVYLPHLQPIFHDIPEFMEIAITVDKEVQMLEAEIEQVFRNRFVQTANEYAIKRREKLLEIQADPETESLDFRKRRIINRQSTKVPFTLRFLQDRLNFLVGEGRAAVSADWLSSILSIAADIGDAKVFKEVEHTIKTVKPACMVYQQQTALSNTILFKEHISMRQVTRMTRLSTTWKLGSTPFAAGGKEVIIK
ncbi:putative phage tail protein [Cytobacillus praedii]|uniref:putative phage tail protein n=1 Tax=Cytobacillus praedii TaxID=1742358 RepID=UPI00070F7744|nr:putative phage tail protein [Cytobacillus praedii]